jgi:short-subunit dehydrogenase
MAFKSALIVGAGSGLSASLARVLTKDGMKVALAARSTEKLGDLARETNAKSFACDAGDRAQVEKLFAGLDVEGAPDVVVYNASYRTRGPFIDLDPAEVEKSVHVTAFAAFLMAQAAVKRMLPRGHGAVLFTGASASVKGYAQSAPFAMGKFALRGLAQSMARELSPQGIHVALRHRWRDPQRAPREPAGQAGLAARSGRDCRDLSRRTQPAAQRLVARD